MDDLDASSDDNAQMDLEIPNSLVDQGDTSGPISDPLSYLGARFENTGVLCYINTIMNALMSLESLRTKLINDSVCNCQGKVYPLFGDSKIVQQCQAACKGSKISAFPVIYRVIGLSPVSAMI